MLLQSYLRLDEIMLPLLTKDTVTQVFLSLTAPCAPIGKPLPTHLLVCSIPCLFPFTLVTHCTWFHPWTTCLDKATILTTFENFSKAVHFMAFPKPHTALETDGLLINYICLHKNLDPLSDQEPQFISQLWKSFCSVTQTNDLAEHAYQDLEANKNYPWFVSLWMLSRLSVTPIVQENNTGVLSVQALNPPFLTAKPHSC